MKNRFTLTGMFFYLLMMFLGVTAQAAVDPDIVVALDGSGDFIKIQDAIDAVPLNSDRQTIILLRNGLYNTEKLIVPSGKDNITLVGESRENTIISYHIYDCAGGLNNKCPAEDVAKWSGDNIRTSATLTVLGNGFRAENLTIENTAGPVGQAQAITLRGDRTMFINCNLKGYQDTIYFWAAGKRHYFEGCMVLGRTDYIYGDGIAWFEDCEIRSWGGGWITAPSTPESQPYGYIFNNCELTFVTGSPRGGNDDVSMVALGRPWHNYPKVTWMNTEMTEKIDPLGWPTTWNMDYAATSDKLELYEYNNTGPGADMSRRADWAGIKELTAEEAAEITIENVFNGWDPTAEAPLVKTYTWTGNGAEDNWLLAENWDPSGDEASGVPAAGESATADGSVALVANEGTFAADLALQNGAQLYITSNSTVNYLTISGAEIHSAADVSLDGKISTKGDSKFVVPASGKLSLNASLMGVHALTKEGAGVLVLPAANLDFSGNWLVQEGTLEANADNSLGKGSVEVNSAGTLVVGSDNAFQPTSVLKVVDGASLELNATITLSEFYIDGVMQPLGEYTATTNPDMISGTGKVVVGRPSQFSFTGASSANWDEPANFSPALMPEAGETVIVEREIETTGTAFPADLIVNSPGNIRLRGVHSATGEITLNEGTRINYATGGTGFTLDAPITIAGDVRLEMNSGNEAGSAMELPGDIKGEGKVSAVNSRDVTTTATVKLSGDNSQFTGTWDLSVPPRNAAGSTAIEGLSANAFGAGNIEVGAGNKVIFSHENAVTDHLDLTLSEGGMAVLNVDLAVETMTLNGEEMMAGSYDASTHPELFEGEGSIIVASGPAVLSSDATLAGITVNGEAVAGFSAEDLEYDIEMWADDINAVEVTATTTHAQAEIIRGSGTVDVSQESPIVHEIEVKAEDGTTQVYTLNFMFLQVGIPDLSSSGIIIHPNPASDELKLSNAEKIEKIFIYNSKGQLLKAESVKNTGLISLPTTDLAHGLYLLKAVQQDGVILQGKFIKE